MKISVIITAGGTSSRFGQTNKLLEKIYGKEVIKYTVEAFLAVSEIDELVISANKSIIGILNEFFKDNSKVRVTEGGVTRQESVYNGLKAVNGADYVLIHDGARPMISSDTIKKAIAEVQSKKALTVATKTTDTIKRVDKDLKIEETIDRSCLYNTQTPQAFDYELIKSAHDQLAGANFTDDAGMLEKLGKDVYILEGEYTNIKITTQNDIDIAKIYIKSTGKR